MMQQRTGLRRALRREYVGAAALGLLVLGALALAFGRSSVEGGTEIHLDARTAMGLQSGSAVRIAGLDVGRVTDVQHNGHGGARVTLKLKPSAPALRSSDRFDIEPRLAFEGNFYVRVSRGDPSAAVLRAGSVVPSSHVTSAVQLDELFSTLKVDTREAVRESLGAVGSALGRPGTTGDTGSRALRRAVTALEGGAKDLQQATRAMRGQQGGDLPRTVRGMGDFMGELSERPRTLQDLVAGYRQVFGTVASRETRLRGTVTQLAAFLRGTEPDLDRIIAGMPEIRALAVDVVPVLHALPTAQTAFRRALDEFGVLMSRPALPALVERLESPVASLPDLSERLAFLLPRVAPIGKCFSAQIVPMLESKVQDGRLTIDQPVWQQLLHTTASLAGASSDFDANGTTIRAGMGTGDNILQATIPGLGEVIQAGTSGAVGVNPPWLGYNVRPAKRPDVPCHEQQPVNLSSTPHMLPSNQRKVLEAPQAGMSARDKQRDAVGVLRDARRLLADDPKDVTP